MKIKRISIFVFLLSITIFFIGCNSKLENSSNTLKITKEDEKTILEYLDIKTIDIDEARVGKMYSAFSILGTDEDSIYIWLLKEEYFKQGNEIVQQGGVSLPVVLYIEKSKNGIEIKNHKYPGDGEQYGKDIKKLFPRNVIDEINRNYNERVEKLEEIIKSRVEEELIEKQTNKNDENSKKDFLGDSQTYRLMHNLLSSVPDELPPAGV